MPKRSNNPQTGFYGSTIIVDFDSREALDVWLAEEPFLKPGFIVRLMLNHLIKHSLKDKVMRVVVLKFIGSSSFFYGVGRWNRSCPGVASAVPATTAAPVPCKAVRLNRKSFPRWPQLAWQVNRKKPNPHRWTTGKKQSIARCQSQSTGQDQTTSCNNWKKQSWCFGAKPELQLKTIAWCTSSSLTKRTQVRKCSSTAQQPLLLVYYWALIASYVYTKRRRQW